MVTLNDWVIERLDRPPRRGDNFDADQLRVVVRKTQKVLVQEAYLQPIEKATSAGEGISLSPE